MLEKGKISAYQMEFMMFPTIIATGVLTIPAISGKFAQHDMWLTPIFGSSIGFITIFIVWKLHQMFPGLTPIQYSELILGKVLGKIFSLFLVCFLIYNTGLVVRQYADFITSNVMLQTPNIVFYISLLFVSALAVRGGIEVIARSAVICTTIFLSTSIAILLLIKDIDLSYMLPFLENGLLPVMKGSFVHNAWFSEFFLLAFIYPFISNQQKSLKSGFKSSLYVMLILFYFHFFVLTLLGDTTELHLYPVYIIVRAISVLETLENFEVLVTASWVLGNFIKVSVFLYIACLALAQFLKLSNYRIIVFPVCLLSMFFSYWDLPSSVELMDYMTKIQPFYFITIQTIVPLFFLIIALGRKKRSESG